MIVLYNLIAGLDYAASPIINPFISGFEAKDGFVLHMILSQLVW
jgi:hypothetical protein